MALGTITITKGSGQPSENLFADFIAFPGEASYLAGGSAFKAAFQAKAGDAREPVAVIAGDCGGYVPVYIPSTGKLKVYYADNNNAADGPMIEVPDATVLSGVTFNLTVISR